MVAGHRLDGTSTALLLTLGLGVFAGALDLGVLSPALPAIAREFGVATSDLAWLFTLYLLVTVASIAIASALADRYGRRWVYVACVIVFGLGSLLAIASHQYSVLLLARAIQALGAGGIFPVATAAIGDVVPPARRGAALGLIAATWGVAAIMGPLFGGIVTHFIAWRWIFVLNIPLALVVLWFARTTLPSVAAHRRGPLDIAGLGLLCGSLLLLMAGMTAGRAIVIALGILGLVGFALLERAVRNPVIPLRLFARPQLAKAYALELLIGMLEGSLFFVPTVLINAAGLSYVAAGVVAAIGAFTFVLVIPYAGRALDRIGSRDVLLAGALFTEVGLAIFAIGFSSPLLAIVAMVVAGVGFGALLGAPTRYIVTNETAPTTRATAVGILSQFLIVGQILGGSLAGGIFFAAQTEMHGYRLAYLVFSVIAFAAMIVAGTLAPRERERALYSKKAIPGTAATLPLDPIAPR